MVPLGLGLDRRPAGVAEVDRRGSHQVAVPVPGVIALLQARGVRLDAVGVPLGQGGLEPARLAAPAAGLVAEVAQRPVAGDAEEPQVDRSRRIPVGEAAIRGEERLLRQVVGQVRFEHVPSQVRAHATLVEPEDPAEVVRRFRGVQVGRGLDRVHVY